MPELPIYEYRIDAARLAVPLEEVLRYMGVTPAGAAAAGCGAADCGTAGCGKTGAAAGCTAGCGETGAAAAECGAAGCGETGAAATERAATERAAAERFAPGTLEETKALAQRALAEVRDCSLPALLYSVLFYREDGSCSPVPDPSGSPGLSGLPAATPAASGTPSCSRPRSPAVFDAGFGPYESTLAASYLAGCAGAVFFVATAGFGTDRLTARYKSTRPSYALAVSAAGTALVEALCDTFCHELPQMPAGRNPFSGRAGLHYKTRISPGYGDFPLSCQPAILTRLDAYRRLGIRLSDQLLMTPAKSVTAVIGIRQGIPARQETPAWHSDTKERI